MSVPIPPEALETAHWLIVPSAQQEPNGRVADVSPPGDEDPTAAGEVNAATSPAVPTGGAGMSRTVLDRIAAGRIDRQAQWRARWAICRHVRISGVGRDEIGPRYRRGSNSWRPNFVECLFDPAIVATPCPNCGGPGDDLLGGRVPGWEYCPTCRTPIQVGDYDWTELSDVLRYLADREAGLVEGDEDVTCSRCRRPFTVIDPRGVLDVVCDRADCHLQRDGKAAPLDPPRTEIAIRRSPSRPVPLPLRSGLDDMLGRLEAALGAAADRTGAAPGETAYDASRRAFDEECAAAKLRDLQRERSAHA